MTAHLLRPEPANDDAFLAATATALHDRFGIEHATIQIERRAFTECSCGTVCESAQE